MTRWLFPLLLLALAGCTGNRQARRLEGRFDLGDPDGQWRSVKPGSADKAWFHDGIGASLYADSNCATRFDDRPLPKLAEAVVYGMASGEPLREEPLTVDGRDAWMRVADAQIDGVTLRVGVVVLKKDECVYDLLYLAPPTTFDTGWPAFESVIAGFRTQGG